MSLFLFLDRRAGEADASRTHCRWLQTGALRHRCAGPGGGGDRRRRVRRRLLRELQRGGGGGGGGCGRAAEHASPAAEQRQQGAGGALHAREVGPGGEHHDGHPQGHQQRDGGAQPPAVSRRLRDEGEDDAGGTQELACGRQRGGGEVDAVVLSLRGLRSDGLPQAA